MHRTEQSNRHAHDPNRLATYLHAKAEREKAALTRDLHDNMGGLMVAAVMDLTWAQQNVPVLTHDVRNKLKRVRESLSSALDLKRRIIESLRPTLLDNVGLFASLSWLLKMRCSAQGLAFSGSFPPNEIDLPPDIAIVIYRLSEEALHLAVAHPRVRSVRLSAQAENHTLILRVANDGAGVGAWEEDPPDFISLQHRVRTLRGTLTFVTPPEGGAALEVALPIHPLEQPSR
jgi:signal transduction histidine kinase